MHVDQKPHVLRIEIRSSNRDCLRHSISSQVCEWTIKIDPDVRWRCVPCGGGREPGYNSSSAGLINFNHDSLLTSPWSRVILLPVMEMYGLASLTVGLFRRSLANLVPGAVPRRFPGSSSVSSIGVPSSPQGRGALCLFDCSSLSVVTFTPDPQSSVRCTLYLFIYGISVSLPRPLHSHLHGKLLRQDAE
jgi:hypothetical protein